MRTLGFLPARSSSALRGRRSIYTRHRPSPGNGLIRGELEDLAFSYLEPEAYQELQKTVVSKRKEFEAFLVDLQDTVRKRLEEMDRGRSRGPSQAALFDSSEKPPPASHYRPDL